MRPEKQEEIRSLLNQGYSVFPLISGTKLPMVEWKPYQERLPELSLVNAWLRAWPNASWGVVCGKVSALTVVDVDPRNGGDKTMAQYPALPPTVISGRGDGGYHTYIRTAEAISTRKPLLPGVDLKGVGSFVVAPGSVHASGGMYQLVGEPLSEIPGWLATLLACPPTHGACTIGRSEPKEKKNGAGAVPEGGRNDHLWRIGRQAKWYGAVPNQIEHLLWAENAANCKPPLPDEEVQAIIRGVIRRA